MSLDTRVELAPGTAVVLQGNGLTMVPDPTRTGSLDLDALSFLAATASSGTRSSGDSRMTATADVVDHARLRAGHLVVRTPLVLGLSALGFECRDHDGRLVMALDARELAAMAELRRPTSASDAWNRHLVDCGAAALSEDEFLRLVGRLVATGICAFAEGDVALSRLRSRATRAWAAHTQNIHRIDAAVQRRVAEHEANRASTDTRVNVIGVHPAGICPPLAIGMVLAYAREYDGGRLEKHYDFFPRWILRKESPLLKAVTTTPAIYLFSNYIWSSRGNFDVSAEVKRRSPGSIVIHGGPDTPKYPADTTRFFAEHPEIDIAVRGEGEATMAAVLDALSEVELDGAPPHLSVLREVAGIAFRDGDEIVRTADRDRITDVDEIPSPYLNGLLDAYGEALEGTAIIETNRGCPYGCTFCDWGSATLSRIRKFDLDRVFAELEWCAQRGVTRIWVADANFGIFERDVEIAEKVAALKEQYGCPTMFSTNYAKNTVKHLKHIVKVMADAGILTQGLLSLQTMDDDTLATINRSNIKVEKYEDLAKEFRDAGLPLFVDLMLGLPGATMASFRTDLQECIDREVSAKIFPTRMLVNSPMNNPEYRAANRIEIDVVPGSNEPQVVATSTFTRADHAAMLKLRATHLMCENHGVLRQVSRFVRQEAGIREIDFYENLGSATLADRGRWPAASFVFDQGASLMVPPVSWRLFIDDVHAYLVDEIGLPDDDALETVLSVQHALIPTPGREFPQVLDLAHDYGAWYACVVREKDAGHRADWPVRVPRLRDLPAASFTVDDPHQVCTLNIGSSVDGDAYSDWELRSPVARSMPASHMGV
jgi:hypothetical protein